MFAPLPPSFSAGGFLPPALHSTTTAEELKRSTSMDTEVRQYAHALAGFLDEFSGVHAEHPEDFLLMIETPQLRDLLDPLAATLTEEMIDDLAAVANQISSYRGVWDAIEAPAAIRTLASAGSRALAQFFDQSLRLRLRRDPIPMSAEVATDSLLASPQLLSGMCPKKRHEAVRVHQIVSKLAAAAQVQSVINVGEGKGYVSRLLALDSGLQVIGLDCNPAHRESSSGRLERTFDQLAETVGLRYRPRGDMRSVTCLVDANMDWTSVLRDPEGVQVSHRTEDEFTAVKVRCVVCGSVMRKRADVLQQHANKCGNEADPTQFESVAQPRLQQFPRGAHLIVNEPGSGACAVRVIGFDSGSNTHRVIDIATGLKRALNFDTALVSPPEFAAPVEPTRVSVRSDLQNCGVMGLHTCGDLGSNILRLFAKSSSPFLVVVSCCWHALSPGGFPLSTWLRELRTADTHIPVWRRFTNVSMMLATQPMDAWGHNGVGMSRDSLKLMFYRSLLPFVLPQTFRPSRDQPAPETLDCSHRGRGCTIQPGFLRSLVKVKDTLSFSDFVSRVQAEYFPELRSDAALKEKSAAVWQQKQSFFKRFAAFALLRMWLAPLLENMLLVDRLQFLAETLPEANVALLPLFDGTISPRMFALVAMRKLASPL
jgi:hypothetical protein